jgi:branched-chain amino acid transport system ATP-binding protein
MLRLDGVSVSIGPVTILRGVNLDVAAGQFAGLIGRNGAGKTTLLRTIMGLLRPAAGTLDFLDSDLAALPTHKRAALGIGYMPEDRRLVPALSAEENILLPAWAGDADDAPAQLASIYRTIPELDALRARKALQLSGGQQKLVALGRALMAGRKLLLLDEPFEGVARCWRGACRVIAGLARRACRSSSRVDDHAHSLLTVISPSTAVR